MALAIEWGVQVPNDFVFVLDEFDACSGSLSELLGGGEMVTALGPSVAERQDGYVYWSDHYTKLGIVFRIHPDILKSDEAIVAVVVHEVFEMEKLREVCHQDSPPRMWGDDYLQQTRPDRNGNFHALAWDEADRVVRRMREGLS